MTRPEGYDRREKDARRGRKLRDIALLLPIGGAIAFTSPVLDTFASANADVGHKMIYIFGCWIVLIVCSFLLSRALRAEIRDK